MELKGLPKNFEEWEKMRKDHLQSDLQYSHFTKDLFKQYQKHLGQVRYRLLLEAQTLVVPYRVRELLGYRRISLLTPVLGLYKLSRKIKLNWLLKAVILPSDYKNEIRELDVVSASCLN